MTIERETALKLAHQDRIRAVLAETGNEIIHPTHFKLRESMRLAVLAAIDEVTNDRYGKRLMSDGELPALFKTIDAIAERVFLKSVGL